MYRGRWSWCFAPDRADSVWGGRAGQIVDLVNLNIERKGYVVTYDFKVWVVEQVEYIVHGAGEKIVNTDNVMSIIQQSFTEMRYEKACSASNYYLFFSLRVHGHLIQVPFVENFLMVFKVAKPFLVFSWLKVDTIKKMAVVFQRWPTRFS